MNKELLDVIKKLDLHPVSYQKINHVYIIKTKDNSYAIKLNTSNYDIYKYLLSKGFNNFPDNYNTVNDNYDISKYIYPLIVSNEQKINDYLKLIAILHFKTSYIREIDLDEIKEKYENLTNEINKLREYYLSINDTIDHHIFLSPAEYLLVRNISLIYRILNIVQDKITKLYEKIKNMKSIRVSLLHNNLSLDHLIINEGEYLISWNKSYFDSPINELVLFYRKYHKSITINDFINIYEKTNKLSEIEKELLLIYLSIPKKIVFTDNNYLNTKLVNDEINYLKSIYSLLLK